MMRMFLVLLALQGCALDEPETSTDELALGSYDSFEIESGSISGSIHRVNDVTAASGGAYLSLDGTGYVRFFFNASSGRTFWARVNGTGSMSVTIDGQSSHYNISPTGWKWQSLGTRSMSGAQHTFRIDVDEPGLQIDRILYKPATESFTPVTETYEAETASLVFPMGIASQRFPPTTYVWAPTGSGTTGQLDLDVSVPWNGDGYYRVWVRANAQTEAHNTLVFGHDGVTTTAFDVPLTSTTGYTWSLASGLAIDSTGEAIASVRDSESGVKIDKILITNDTGFQLVESSPPLTKSL